MTPEVIRHCRSCGAEGAGRYCSRCGTAYSTAAACPHCGGQVKRDAIYCSACGERVGPTARKPAAAYLPWVLSGLALLAFALAISFFVQDQSAPRQPGETITGGLPDATAAPAAAGGPAAGMPSAEELARMSPREAADRLYDRAMREAESGDPGRAEFFAEMGVDAYARVPANEVDGDLRFHVGLLHLVAGDVAAARSGAEAFLDEDPRDLFGLMLLARAAQTEKDEAETERAMARLREAVADGESPRDPRYEPHADLIEASLATGN